VDVVAPLLDNILATAEANLVECNRPVALISLTPGSEVAWDGCCDGELWARVIDITPVSSSRNCDIDYILVTAGLGVVRCFSGLDTDGLAPTAAEMTADTVSMLADADALLRALQANSVTIGRGVPLGPSGLCGGFEWTFTARLTLCPGC